MTNATQQPLSLPDTPKDLSKMSIKELIAELDDLCNLLQAKQVGNVFKELSKRGVWVNGLFQ